MSLLLPIGLFFAGPILAYITKNTRWWLLTILAFALFWINIIYAAFQLVLAM